MGDVVQPDATGPAGELRVLTRAQTSIGSANRRRVWDLGQLATHVVLLGACLVALGPVVLIVINSMKSRESIFGRPFDLPIGRSFDLAGYELVFGRAHFPIYFLNSVIVTLGSTALILAVGAMAAHALAEYRFRLNRWLVLYFALGIMISIRLGSVGIVRLMSGLGLTNTLWALLIVYTAAGLPLTIFVMTQFMRQIPTELKQAARIDGANEYRVFWLVLPLVRPVIATIAVFVMIPVWNDLWFPLILAPAENVRTVTLGTQAFIGSFGTNWQGVLAALTLALIPPLVFYAVFSRQLLRGLTAGAVKG
jgi:raffinose/stachyose/melibiose transport system permease protein